MTAQDPAASHARIEAPGCRQRDATLHTDGRSWTIAAQDGAGQPVTVSGSSADGLAALSALFGALGPGAGPTLPAEVPAKASGRRAFPAIDHAATPPPRPMDWYRPPTDEEIADVLRRFDYGRIKARLPGKWVIAYSVYGDDPFYTVGALKNAVLGPRLFPEFVSRFYVGASVPRWIVQLLEQMPKVEVVDMTDRPEGPRAMFWRFLAPGDPDVDVYLCRDTDSRLTVRDRAAVNEWLASDRAFHIIRDAAAGAHNAPMVGCHWGCRAGALRDVRDLIRAAGEYPDVKGVDQEFLWAHVYPRALWSVMIHDDCAQIEPPGFEARRPFPTPMRDPWDRAAPIIQADDTSP